MALSSEAKKAYNKAHKVRKKRHKNKHWFFLRPEDSYKEIFSKIFTQIAAITLVVCVVILFDYFKASFINSQLNNTLQDLYGSVSGVLSNDELLPNANKLLEINPDTVGWIKVNNTKIDLPVVLKKDDNPEEYYYLTHNFNGNQAKAGTVFIDYRSTIEAGKQSDNLVLYGHNEADGTMFGELKKYKNNIEFYKENPVIEFNTNYETGQYKIIGIFIATVLPEQSRDGEVFDYHNYIDMDEARYNDFIENVEKRTEINTTVDTKYGDKFITLSTCSNEFQPSRLVVIARKIRHGEDSWVDVDNAAVNEDAMTPDYDYIYSR